MYVQHLQEHVTKVPLTSFNKYLHNDTSEAGVDLNTIANNGNEKL
jgi:hypothetical protein